MSEIDQQFIEYVVKSLVGKPQAVKIERRIDEKGVLLELTVDPEDLGRVIGKRGATAQSLRTLLRALGTKNDARYNLKIIDNGPADGTKPAPRPKDEPAAADDNQAPVPEQPESTEPATEKLVDKPAEEPASDSSDDDAKTSDRLRQARAELDELDDLDI
jgi:predicted RNA-binding protein YlqC (UPF0109 family)